MYDRIMDYISYHGEDVLLVIVVAGLGGSCIANLLSK
jgi:tRNA A22 N-methylase